MLRKKVHSIKARVPAWKESMRVKYPKSTLGKYRIRKESNRTRKNLSFIRRGQGPEHPLYKDGMHPRLRQGRTTDLISTNHYLVSTYYPIPRRLAIFSTVVNPL